MYNKSKKILAITIAICLWVGMTISSFPAQFAVDTVNAATQAETSISSIQSIIEQSEELKQTLDDYTSRIPILPESEDPNRPIYHPGELVLVFEESMQAVATDEGIGILSEPIFQNEQIAIVEVPEEMTLEEAIYEANQTEGILFAQPNFYYYLFEEETDIEPMDSHASPSVEPVEIDDPYKTHQWPLTMLGMLSVWGYGIPNASDNAIVAVLDTGVDMNHPDLQDNLIKEYCYDAVERLPMRPESTNGGDNNGHGTMVAGVVAATPNNGMGVAGISYNAKMFVVDVFHGEGAEVKASTGDIAHGFSYAIAKGATIVNMSFGSVVPTHGDLNATDLYLESLIEGAKNTVLAVSSGGNGVKSDTSVSDFVFPADLDHCISVTAIDNTENYIANYYYSDKKDIAAPGQNIATTYPTALQSNGLVLGSGTSLAAPHVAATLALMKAMAPEMTTAQLRTLLYDTARDPNTQTMSPGIYDIHYGHGIVNPLSAVQTLYEQMHGGDIPLESITLNKSSLKMNLGKTATLSVVSFTPEDTTDDMTPTWTSSHPQIIEMTGKGGQMRAKSGGTSTITCDVNGVTATCVVTVEIPNIPLTGFALHKSEVTLKVGKTATLSLANIVPANATIPENVKWFCNNTAVVNYTGNAPGQIRALKPGSVTITCQIGSVKAYCKVTVVQ